MKEDIRQYILQELLGGRSDAELSTDEDILSTGIIDSMGAMRLINFIENKFAVKIPPEDMVIENFITIEAMESYIASRQS